LIEIRCLCKEKYLRRSNRRMAKYVIRQQKSIF